MVTRSRGKVGTGSIEEVYVGHISTVNFDTVSQIHHTGISVYTSYNLSYSDEVIPLTQTVVEIMCILNRNSNGNPLIQLSWLNLVSYP